LAKELIWPPLGLKWNWQLNFKRASKLSSAVSLIKTGDTEDKEVRREKNERQSNSAFLPEE